MSEDVIMPLNDYKNACDTIRMASGKTDLIKSGDMPSEISALTNKIGKVALKSSTLPSLSSSSDYWVSVAYGNGKFVAISRLGEAAYSVDCINWTSYNLPVMSTSTTSSNSYVLIEYYKNKFITMTNTTIIYYSTDGINWVKGYYTMFSRP